jgi:NAD+ synthase (glutamine-hydrolysing)
VRPLRIALAQINPTVGDFEGNVSKIINYVEDSVKAGAQLVVFPELAITGYPPEDLLLKTHFIEDNLGALRKVQKKVKDIVAVVGFVDRMDDIYNAAAIVYNKKLVGTYHKMYLPNYGVFDELRYFQAGRRCAVYRIGDVCFGVNICEDIWYPEGPARMQALAGAEVIININASPYRIGKNKFRENMLSTRASDSIAIVVYLNTVGGQDELVFDGDSLVLDENGNISARGKPFKEDLVIADLDLDLVRMKRFHAPRRRQEVVKLEKDAVEEIVIPVEEKVHKVRALPLLPSVGCKTLEPIEEVYEALVLGTSEYVRKNGFKGVVIGQSGGIDSSLVSTIAADAVGPENVTGLFMPSPYTSKESREDVFSLANNLGIEVVEVPIHSIFKSYLDALKEIFRGLPENVTEENIQARIRGNILMAFSNKFGRLVLTTGNKSEMSVGYATLYGDMAGGFAVIKDVPKTMVYELCRWKNKREERVVISERVIMKEPSAELKPNQKDTDTLPPYSLLDPVLKAYIEDDKGVDEILSLGCEAESVKKIIRMVDTSEYKRRQAPPGIKITQRAFGRDRRFPITNKYRGY